MSDQPHVPAILPQVLLLLLLLLLLLFQVQIQPLSTWIYQVSVHLHLAY